MNIANSVSFLVFGIIMRLLPVLAPTLVAPDAAGVAAAEATTRGLWLVAMGYTLGAIGAWFLLREIGHRGMVALARARQYMQAAREARELARARQIHARTVAAHVAVRVQY